MRSSAWALLAAVAFAPCAAAGFSGGLTGILEDDWGTIDEVVDGAPVETQGTLLGATCARGSHPGSLDTYSLCADDVPLPGKEPAAQEELETLAVAVVEEPAEPSMPDAPKLLETPKAFEVQEPLTEPVRPEPAPDPATTASPAPPGTQATLIQPVSSGPDLRLLAVAAALAAALVVKVLLGSLFTRLHPSRLLQHRLRARVHEAVSAEPGIHFLGLVRRTSMAKGTLDHHLRKLVDAGLVHRLETKGGVCFFAGQPDAGEAEAASATRSPLARSLLRAVGQWPDATAQELACRLARHPSSVCRHLQRLGRAGLVERHRRGKAFGLRLTDRGALHSGQSMRGVP